MLTPPAILWIVIAIATIFLFWLLYKAYEGGKNTPVSEPPADDYPPIPIPQKRESEQRALDQKRND